MTLLPAWSASTKQNTTTGLPLSSGMCGGSSSISSPCALVQSCPGQSSISTRGCCLPVISTLFNFCRRRNCVPTPYQSIPTTTDFWKIPNSKPYYLLHSDRQFWLTQAQTKFICDIRDLPLPQQNAAHDSLYHSLVKWLKPTAGPYI